MNIPKRLTSPTSNLVKYIFKYVCVVLVKRIWRVSSGFALVTFISYLQSEFNTLNSTLTQLTNQKNVAQKRLDDLDGQVGKFILTESVLEFIQKDQIRTKDLDPSLTYNLQHLKLFL